MAADSSTSNSEATSRGRVERHVAFRGRVPWALVVAVAIVCAFEAFLHTRRPLEGLIVTTGDADQARSVRDVIDVDRDTDVAIVGSSMAYHGFDPRQMSRALEHDLHRRVRVHNYAVRGGEMEVFEQVVNRLLRDPKDRPRAIVVGTGMRDLRDGAPDFDLLSIFWRLSDLRRAMRQYGHAPLATLPQVVRNAVEPFCWSLRYRNGISTWVAQQFYPIDTPPMPATGHPIQKHMGDDATASVDPRLFKQSKFRDMVRERYTDRSIPGKAAIDAARRMAKAATQAGVPLIFVDVPIAPPMAKLISGFNKQTREFEAKYQAAMTRVAADAGVPFVPYASLKLDLTLGDFADSQHLNHPGAIKLGDAITPMLLPTLRRADAGARQATRSRESGEVPE